MECFILSLQHREHNRTCKHFFTILVISSFVNKKCASVNRMAENERFTDLVVCVVSVRTKFFSHGFYHWPSGDYQIISSRDLI